MPKIGIVHDPELDRAARANVMQSDSKPCRDRRHDVLTTFAEQRRGSAEHPLSVHEVEQKFRRLAEDVSLARRSDALIEIVAALESKPNLDEFTSLITTAATAR